MSEVSLNTEKLIDYADRLEKAAKRCNDVSERLTKLIWQIPACAIPGITMADADGDLKECAAFLVETERVYRETEALLNTALITGVYEGTVVKEDKNLIQKATDAYLQWVEEHKDEIWALYDSVREGELDPGSFLDWLDRNVVDIPGWDQENSLPGFIEDIVGFFNHLMDLGATSDGAVKFIGKITESGAQLFPDGPGNAVAILSILDCWDFGFDLAVGNWAMLSGAFMGDKEMMLSGLNYLDSGITKTGDIAIVIASLVAPEFAPFALPASALHNLRVNQYINFAESVIRGDDLLTFCMHNTADPFIETFNDMIAGNFFCQKIAEYALVKPTKMKMETVYDLADWTFGIDSRSMIEQIPYARELYTNDNWLGIFSDQVNYLMDQYKEKV